MPERLRLWKAFLYGIDWGTRCSPTLDIYRKLFWPAKLAVIYPISNEYSLWQIAAALVLLAAISIAVVYSSRCRAWLFVGWFWFIGMLVPTIGLVQVGIQSMADRYTYLPLLGIFIALAWSGAAAVERWPEIKNAVCVVASLALVAAAA